MGWRSCPSGQNSRAEFIHAGMENAERRAEARSATRHWTLFKTCPPACGRRMSRRISDADLLFICICPKTEPYGSVTNSCNIYSAMRLGVGWQAGATSDSSRAKSAPGTSSRLGSPYLISFPAKPAWPNRDSPSRCFKVPARPQMPGAPIRQGFQIPGSPQTRGTKTKNS